MKVIRPCFGKKTMFYKKKLKDCMRCQFKKKCLLETKGVRDDEEEN